MCYYSSNQVSGCVEEFDFEEGPFENVYVYIDIRGYHVSVVGSIGICMSCELDFEFLRFMDSLARGRRYPDVAVDGNIPENTSYVFDYVITHRPGVAHIRGIMRLIGCPSISGPEIEPLRQLFIVTMHMSNVEFLIRMRELVGIEPNPGPIGRKGFNNWQPRGAKKAQQIRASNKRSLEEQLGRKDAIRERELEEQRPRARRHGKENPNRLRCAACGKPGHYSEACPGNASSSQRSLDDEVVRPRHARRVGPREAQASRHEAPVVPDPVKEIEHEIKLMEITEKRDGLRKTIARNNANAAFFFEGATTPLEGGAMPPHEAACSLPIRKYSYVIPLSKVYPDVRIKWRRPNRFVPVVHHSLDITEQVYVQVVLEPGAAAYTLDVDGRPLSVPSDLNQHARHKLNDVVRPWNTTQRLVHSMVYMGSSTWYGKPNSRVGTPHDGFQALEDIDVRVYVSGHRDRTDIFSSFRHELPTVFIGDDFLFSAVDAVRHETDLEAALSKTSSKSFTVHNVNRPRSLRYISEVTQIAFGIVSSTSQQVEDTAWSGFHKRGHVTRNTAPMGRATH